MPATRLERLLAFLGLAATIALAVLTALAWVDYADADSEPPAERVSAAVTTAPVETKEAETTAPAETETEPTRTPEAELALTATRGPCWVQVRTGSAEGELLFAGILEQSATRTFTGEALWLELGARENVDATLSGAAVQLPQGPTAVVVTPEGLVETDA